MSDLEIQLLKPHRDTNRAVIKATFIIAQVESFSQDFPKNNHPVLNYTTTFTAV